MQTMDGSAGVGPREALPRLRRLGRVFFWANVLHLSISGGDPVLLALTMLAAHTIWSLASDSDDREVRNRMGISLGVTALTGGLAAAAFIPGTDSATTSLAAGLAGVAGVASYAWAMAAWCSPLGSARCTYLWIVASRRLAGASGFLALSFVALQLLGARLVEADSDTDTQFLAMEIRGWRATTIALVAMVVLARATWSLWKAQRATYDALGSTSDHDSAASERADS